MRKHWYFLPALCLYDGCQKEVRIRKLPEEKCIRAECPDGHIFWLDEETHEATDKPPQETKQHSSPIRGL